MMMIIIIYLGSVNSGAYIYQVTNNQHDGNCAADSNQNPKNLQEDKTSF